MKIINQVQAKRLMELCREGFGLYGDFNLKSNTKFKNGIKIIGLAGEQTLQTIAIYENMVINCGELRAPSDHKLIYITIKRLVLFLDISKGFDCLKFDWLEKFIDERVKESHIRRMLFAWLIMVKNVDYDLNGIRLRKGKGVAMGLSLSPVIFGFYPSLILNIFLFLLSIKNHKIL